MSGRVTVAAAVGALALGLADCAGRQSVLSPASDQAATLHGLLSLMLWVCGIAYLLVLTFLAVSIWRSRRALEAEPQAAPDDRGLQRGLAAWAALIVLGLVTLAGASFLVDRVLAGAAGDEASSVRVTGHQWWWRIEYREPGSSRWIETANELHLPINRPTRIEVVSSDVIHSFWIPTLSGKLDMVPGRVNRLTITPRQLGWVRGQCAEFCGLQHAQMALDVKVETPAEFTAWLARQAQPAAPATDPDAKAGELLATAKTCGMCHTIRGTTAVGRAGPDLTHLASRRSLAAGTLPMGRSAIMGWIANPQALKPGAEMPATGLAPAEALSLSHYLEGLR